MSDPVLIDESIGKVDGQRAPVRQLRDIWAIDQRQPVVRLAQSPVGKLVLVALFSAFAKLAGIPVSLSVVAAAFAFLPRYRNGIVVAGAMLAMAWHPNVALEGINEILFQQGVPSRLAPLLKALALVAYFACALGVLVLVRRDKTLFVARRPVTSLLGALALLCLLGSSPFITGLPRVALWAFVIVFAAFMWFFAYAVVDQRSRERSPLLFQMGILHPFWGSSSTPFGKGASFLRKHQARTPEELAVTQVKGVKLLIWALLLGLIGNAIDAIFGVHLGIPRAELAYATFMAGKPYPVLVNWGSLIWGTITSAITIAVWGHKIVALARLAGYRLPRNTWRPLEARTLAEFWNRYYYYFKEMLVEFFFFPTFLKTFRKHPRLRVFFATFMAAGVGNALYHFIRDIKYVALQGPLMAGESFVSYLFYCVVLALGIGISQARQTAGRKPSTTFLGTLWSVLCVWGFFVCLHVFGDEARTFPLRDRLAFFASLFGYS
ncbi:hypothetical protein [Janthinobacterium sp. 17J80-10]|uniref:hypothetical protein n=1 Tax=Janthinobacterium sp. 17J80-10 TaxID=2497863 RepID=UPI0010052986|nr:hypothetical protein [Janthinobacterium sp. 17J80-10]QAU33709.1 hypothetical protein EKL02_05650 [Janthinobacterium sp. 17J80-10]